MKYIVTGGAGFIGHNVVRALELQGHKCLILDNYADYDFVPADELKYLVDCRLNRIKSNVFRIDLQNHVAVTNWFNTHATDVDAVIHLASFPRQKVVAANPILASEVMSTALVHLLEETQRASIPKFVYISSSMVYGDFDSGVTEDTICNPIGQYGIMKYMGEQLVRDYTRRGHFDHIIVRPSAVYGEYDVEDRVVSKFILSALRGKELIVNGSNEVLDFTYVEDTAQGIALAAMANIKNETFNITRSHEKVTLHEAAELVIKLVGQGHIVANERNNNFPRRGQLNIDRAVAQLGYDPKIDIVNGFKRYIQWFKESAFWTQQLK